MPITNGTVYGKDARADYYGISSYAQEAHDQMVSTFSESNLLYNKASVIEDIVLNKFLSIYNTAKAINFSNILRKNYILESFTSQDYIDLKFPVDIQLNLDVQNGTLTLPVEKTISLESDSLIIEAESNGQAGNSYAYDYSNADPKVILVADNSSFFEYEKVSNVFATNTLYFSATIRLKSEDVSNGCYIRLYSGDGNNYAEVDSVDISLDGKEWFNVDNTIEVNKADHFIRFMPRRIRFLRVRLKQENYSVFKTAFGPKYRYSIGIREITAKQTRYKTSGEYISIPFSSRKIINGVSFNSSEVAFNDIEYSISANNGAKWVAISNYKTLDMNSEDMGMRGEIDIAQIRVKVRMDRVRSPNSASNKEYIVTNTTDQYFLKYTPIAVQAMLGNHISYGTSKPYAFFIGNTTLLEQASLEEGQCIQAGTTVSTTLFYIPYREELQAEAEIRLNGAILKNDTSVYAFLPHANPEHTLLVMKSGLLDQMQSASAEITYKPFIYDHRYTKVSGPRITLPQSAFVESPEGITIEQLNYTSIAIPDAAITELFDNDITTAYEGVLADGATQWEIIASAGSAHVLSSYSITPLVTDGQAIFSPAKWTLWGSDSPTSVSWAKLDDQEHPEYFWASNEPKEFSLPFNKCAYVAYKWVITANCVADLPDDPDNVTDKATLKIVNINLYDSKVIKISGVNNFSVIPKTDTENTVVLLSNAVYNPECDYRLTYLPSVSLAGFMPEEWDANEISLQSLHKSPVGSKICFEYSYEDTETIRDIEYYTPICHEYRLELS